MKIEHVNIIWKTSYVWDNFEIIVNERINAQKKAKGLIFSEIIQYNGPTTCLSYQLTVRHNITKKTVNANK